MLFPFSVRFQFNSLFGFCDTKNASFVYKIVQRFQYLVLSVFE